MVAFQREILAVRYLNSVVLLAVVGSVAAYGCGGDSGSVSSSNAGTGGEAGMTSRGGAPAGGAVGKAGSTAAGGKAGSGGTGGKAGSAGNGGAAAGGTSGLGGEGGATGGEGGTDNEGGEAGGTQQTVGSLIVTVSGLPTGSSTSVTISGPGGFSKVISATTTIADLAPGTYVAGATPPSIRVAGAQVDSIFDVTVTGDGIVGVGSTANVAVTYAKRPGTGGIWVSNYSSRNVLEFNSAQLATTGAQTTAPVVSLALPALGTGGANSISIAFSSTGDLWAGYCRNGQVPQVVAKFSAAKLSSTSSPTADVVVTLPTTDTSYDCASGLAFDSTGNLWVGTYHGHLLRFDSNALAVTGAPTPSVVISSASFLGIQDILFDGAGNLFVAPYVGTIVARVSAAQLTASSAALVPSVVLSLPSGSGPGGLALDTGGGLWVSDFNHNNLIKYNAADLSATGTPVPALTVGDVQGPQQLAFDKAGNLWVAAYSNSTVLAFAAANLTTGGTKTPLTTLSGDAQLNGSYGVRFDPAP
jgi:hypothetical protein